MATPSSNPLASASASSPSSAPPPSAQSTKRRGAVTSSSKNAPPPSSAPSGSSSSSSKPKKEKKAKGESLAKSKTAPQQGAAPFGFAKVAFRDLTGMPLPENLYLYLRQTGSGGDLREFRTLKDGKVKFLAMAELNSNRYVEFKGSDPGTDAVEADTGSIPSRERSVDLKWVVLPSWKRLTRAELPQVADLSALVPGWASKRFLDFSVPQERATSGAVVFKVVVPTQGGVKVKFADKNGRPLPKGTWIAMGVDTKGKQGHFKPFREYLVGDAGALKEVDLTADKTKNVRQTLSDVQEVELQDSVDGFALGYSFATSVRQLPWASLLSEIDEMLVPLIRGVESRENLTKDGDLRVIKLEVPSVDVRVKVHKKGTQPAAALREGLWLYVGRKGSGTKYEVVKEFKTLASGRLKEVDLVAETGDVRTAGGAEVSEFALPHSVDGASVTYALKAFPSQLAVAKFEESINVRDATLGVDLDDRQAFPLDGGVVKLPVPVAKGCRVTRALAHGFDDNRQRRSDQPADSEEAFEVSTDGTEVPILAVMATPTDVNGFKFEFGSDTIGEALDDPKAFYSKLAGKALSKESKEEKDEEEKKSEGWSFGVEAGWSVARAATSDVVEVEWVGTHDECAVALADRPPKVIAPTGAKKPAPKQRSGGNKDWLVPVSPPDKFPLWVPSFAPNMKDIPFGDGRWVARQQGSDLWHRPRVYKVQAVSCRDPSQVTTIEVHSLPSWGAMRAAKIKPIFNSSLFSISLGPCELKLKVTAGGASIEQFVGWKIDDAVGRIARETKLGANFGEITLTLEFSILSAVTGIPKALLDYIADITLAASLGLGLTGEIVTLEERKYLTKRTGGGPGLSPTTERYAKGSVKATATFAAKLEARIGPRILKFEVSGTVKTAITGTFEYSTEGAGAGQIKRKKSVDREAVKLILAMKVTVGWVFTKEKSREWILLKKHNISLVEEMVDIATLDNSLAAGIAKVLVAAT